MFRRNSLYRGYFKKIRRSVRFLLFRGQSIFRADETPLSGQMPTDLGKRLQYRKIEKDPS